MPTPSLGLHRPSEFIVSVKYRLGCDIFPSAGKCTACPHQSDRRGDHAISCGYEREDSSSTGHNISVQNKDKDMKIKEEQYRQVYDNEYLQEVALVVCPTYLPYRSHMAYFVLILTQCSMLPAKPLTTPLQCSCMHGDKVGLSSKNEFTSVLLKNLSATQGYAATDWKVAEVIDMVHIAR